MNTSQTRKLAASSYYGYGDKKYWEERYVVQQQQTFDWYLTYKQAKLIILQALVTDHQQLEVNKFKQFSKQPIRRGPETVQGLARKSRKKANKKTDGGTESKQEQQQQHQQQQQEEEQQEQAEAKQESKQDIDFASLKVLVVGCGNSTLSADMYEDGWEDVWSMDYSTVVIEKMKEKYQHHKKLKFLVMDIRDMEFANNSFDLVIDKGTLDAVLCGDNADSNAHKSLMECYRVMKPDAHMLILSYGTPDTRMRHFKHPKLNWTIAHKKIPCEPSQQQQQQGGGEQRDCNFYHIIKIK